MNSKVDINSSIEFEKYYISKEFNGFRDPLLSEICTIFEDLRIETFLKLEHRHSQIKQILAAGNTEVYSKIEVQKLSDAVVFAYGIRITMSDLWIGLEAINPSWKKRFDSLANKALNFGINQNFDDYQNALLTDLSKLDCKNETDYFNFSVKLFLVVRQWKSKDSEDYGSMPEQDDTKLSQQLNDPKVNSECDDREQVDNVAETAETIEDREIEKPPASNEEVLDSRKSIIGSLLTSLSDSTQDESNSKTENKSVQIEGEIQPNEIDPTISNCDDSKVIHECANDGKMEPNSTVTQNEYQEQCNKNQGQPKSESNVDSKKRDGQGHGIDQYQNIFQSEADDSTSNVPELVETEVIHNRTEVGDVEESGFPEDFNNNTTLLEDEASEVYSTWDQNSNTKNSPKDFYSSSILNQIEQIRQDAQFKIKNQNIKKPKNVTVSSISGIDHDFCRNMQKYKYLEDSIARNIWNALEYRFEDKDEWSHIEGELDVEKIVEIFSNKYRSRDHQFLVYQEETQKKLAATILIDCSGSTSAYINPLNNRGLHLKKEVEENTLSTSVLDIEKSFAWILFKALNKLTSTINAYGFSSSGNRTDLYKVNKIDSVSSFKSGNENNDGAAIRFTARELLEKKEEIKYLFLLSDGMPTASDNFQVSPLEDTLQALRECRLNKIKVIYLNIDPEPAVYFPEFKKEVLYAKHFVDPLDLPKAIPELVNKVLNDVV